MVEGSPGIDKDAAIALVRFYAQRHGLRISDVINVLEPGESKYADAGHRRLWTVVMEKDLPWYIVEVPGAIAFYVDPDTGNVSVEGDSI